MPTSKICSRCNTEKPAAAFNKNKRRIDGLQTYCRECQRAYDRKNYATSAKRRKQIKNSRTRNTEKNRHQIEKLVVDYLRSHPCVDCGETDIVVLQFDHVRGKKDMPVSVMVSRGYSKNRVMEEITKCEIRCGNCHKRKTARQRDFRSIEILKELMQGE